MKPAPGSERAEPVEPSEALDNESVDAAIDALLSIDPPARFLAAQETGLCIPVPPEVPLKEGQEIGGGIPSALELCLLGDLPAIVEAWQRARARRIAHVVVRLRHEPDHQVTMHFLDARHRYGIYLVAIVGTRGPIEGRHQQPALFRPRICTIDRDELSVVKAVSPAVAQILGWTAEDLLGNKTLDLVHPDDRGSAIANWMEMLARPGFNQRAVMRYRHRDGQYIWFEVEHSNVLNDPARRLVRSEMVDVSERMDAIEQLRAGEQLLRRLTEALPLGVIQIDAARKIVYRNVLVGEILGTADGDRLGDWFAGVACGDREPLDSALRDVLENGAAAELEMTVGEGAGARRCNLSVRALSAHDDAVTGAILCISDVTERVKLREELEARAKFDMLTRCSNRASILETLEEMMRRSRETGNGVAVVFVDLDGFKAINDRYGHAAGDEVLRLTAERLSAAIRGGDVVGRLGGDEFLIVCPEVGTPDMALALADRIGAALKPTVVLESAAIEPGASIGVAWTDSAVGCDAIVALADEAMYEAKRGAGGPVLILHSHHT
jgi:diguanylate cyclase (GGDEF)-like protein/PAS domain S-box-containing protein